MTIKQELVRNPQLVTPALLTLDEYLEIANKDGKWHPDSAYDWTVERLNEVNSEEYPRLLNTITLQGIRFEIRAKVIDRHKDLVYAKTKPNYDPYGDNIVRINGEVQYYTPEELEALGITKWDYCFAIYEKDTGQLVAVSQDEWGAILIAVAREYRGFGLGRIISMLTRDYLPEKGSGGFTNSGHRTFVKTHREFVRSHLLSGKYNRLIRTGAISKERVKEIIASAKLGESRPESRIKFSNKRGDFNVDPSHWLLHYNDGGSFIIYDRRLKGHWNTDLGEYWKERFFIGMIYASEGYTRGSKIAYLHQFGGLNDQIKRFLLMLQLTECKRYGEVLRLEQEEVNLLEPEKVTIAPTRDKGRFHVTLKGEGIDYGGICKAERAFRKSFDRYGELDVYVQETAYGIYNAEYAESKLKNAA